jgi:hypothetical protein
VTATNPIIYRAADATTIHIIVLDELLNKKILAICKKSGPKNTIRNIGLIMALFIS